MPVTRLYVNGPLTQGLEVELDADHSHYLRKVLRLSCGDRLTLFNGHGGEFLAEITLIGRDAVRCLPVAFVQAERELMPRVHLVQAAVRSEKIDAIVQKATELGAASFQIAVSERAQLRLAGDKLANRLGRWRKIIVEAAEQSGRTSLPTIAWRERLDGIKAAGSGFYLHPAAELAWPAVRQALAAASDVTLAVGPEGGWSKKDMATLSQLGLVPLRFGPRIMRTETAAPALLAAVQAILD